MKSKLFIRFIALFLCSSFISPNIAMAHSGRTDRSGCHRQTSNDTKHCHSPSFEGSSSGGSSFGGSSSGGSSSGGSSSGGSSSGGSSSGGSSSGGSSSGGSTPYIIGGVALGVTLLYFLIKGSKGSKGSKSTKSNSRNDRYSTERNRKEGRERKYIDLELSSIASNYNPVSGEQITLTLSVLNNSDTTATDVKISTDIAQDGLRFIFYEAEEGNYNPATGIWDLARIKAQETKELKIKAVVEANNINLTSEVIFAREKDLDSTPNNNRPEEDDQAIIDINSLILNLLDLESENSQNLRISHIPNFANQLEELKKINGTEIYVDSFAIKKDEYYLKLKYKF